MIFSFPICGVLPNLRIKNLWMIFLNDAIESGSHVVRFGHAPRTVEENDESQCDAERHFHRSVKHLQN